MAHSTIKEVRGFLVEMISRGCTENDHVSVCINGVFYGIDIAAKVRTPAKDSPVKAAILVGSKIGEDGTA